MYAFTHLHDLHASFLRRKQLQLIIQTPSDQPSREAESFQYNSPDYVLRLEQKDSYMHEYDDIDEEDNEKNMKTYCKILLEGD